MSAQQATADGGGYQRGHSKHRHGGCRARKRDHNGECHGVIGRTTRGISEAFGIPRKGVLIAFILILVFSFPVGVMLFGIAWAYVHHPDWFNGLRGKRRGASHQTRYDAKTTSASSTAPEDRPTMGVDFEEPWMDELREKFDDLERRTGSMEGFVASGDYGLASELEQMKKADASNDAAKDGKDTGSSPSDKA